ncbi:MAG TPA: hypothetical protein DCW90_02035 [Lachnospiraceae bacterium]|nr:hypothetical protein [Lachnospiraceae bacterium]
MIYKYGIDFGTTNSSIAMRFVGDDKEEHTLVVDVKDTSPRETMPSVVLIDRDGKISVGEKAINQYVQNGTNSKKQLFIKRIKLDLENEGSSLSYNVGNHFYDGVDLIAAILKELRVKAEKMANELEIDMSGVVMGVPVQYGDIQKDVLKKALVKAGYYENYQEADAQTEFVSEPVAVAVHYGFNLKNDKTVMVFDFGGGTLDLAIVNLKNQIGIDRLHPHETLAKERITLGGEELTRLFFINKFCDSHKYGTKRIASEFDFSRDLNAEQLWEKLSACEEGIRFISAVERCKCDLTYAQKYKFSFIGKNIQIDEKTFYRDDFTEAIEEKLAEIDDLIELCLEDANITDPFDIDHVILAGGSSLIPAVQDLLRDRFGNNRVASKITEQDAVIKSLKRIKVSESEVLTSIVRGLAMVGCKDEALIEDVVDSDYGYWDDRDNEFIPLIKKGTLVKDTEFDKLTKKGIYDEIECFKKNASPNQVSSVQVSIYQRNLNGVQKLGTVTIRNTGSKKYRIYMNIDRKSGMLTVTLYDGIQQRWMDEIPEEERQFTLTMY